MSNRCATAAIRVRRQRFRLIFPAGARTNSAPVTIQDFMLNKAGKAVIFQTWHAGAGGAGVFLLGRIFPLDRVVDWLHSHVARYQPWSMLAYPLVHALCNLLLLPAGVLVVGSGFLFGLWRGFLLALTGHLLGAAGAFWISRTFARGFIERHLASRPQWRALDLAIEREGWKIVFLSQFSPLVSDESLQLLLRPDAPAVLAVHVVDRAGLVAGDVPLRLPGPAGPFRLENLAYGQPAGSGPVSCVDRRVGGFGWRDHRAGPNRQPFAARGPRTRAGRFAAGSRVRVPDGWPAARGGSRIARPTVR